MSEALEIFYRGVYEGLLMSDKEGQLSGLNKVQEELNELKAELESKEDIQCLEAASSMKDKVAAFDGLSNESRELWDDYSGSFDASLSVFFAVYMGSEYEEVREEAGKVVDVFIDEHFGEDIPVGPEPIEGQEDQRVNEISYFHDLLYLSTFGGGLTKERADVHPLSYEFNVQNEKNYQPAVPWNPMERLMEDKMVKGYESRTNENNLTDAGVAVLARLDERFGPSKFAKDFTQNVSMNPS